MRLLTVSASAIATLEKEKACCITDSEGENNWVNRARIGVGIDGLSVVYRAMVYRIRRVADDYDDQSSAKIGVVVGGRGSIIGMPSPDWLTGIRGLIQPNKGA